MSARTIVLRRAARLDIDRAIDFYVENEAPGAAHRFVDELEVAFEHLARFPESGSPRYAQELSLTGLRHWSLQRHPYLVFYVPGDDYVDVWRVLHAERDIPEWLRGR